MNIKKHGRIASDIQRIMANELREYADPVKHSVTRVELSSDASAAKIFISSADGIDDASAAVKLLEKHSGKIRSALAVRLNVRAVPAIKFIPDGGFEYAQHLEELFNEINNKD